MLNKVKYLLASYINQLAGIKNPIKIIPQVLTLQPTHKTPSPLPDSSVVSLPQNDLTMSC